MANDSIPAGERLDMKDVIAETVDLGENILYATPISAEETASILNQMKEVFAEGATAKTTQTLIDNLDTNLKSTNSNQFYNGDVAQQNINNMKNLKDDIGHLSNYTESIVVEEITNRITEYNEHLKNLKKNSRRELLEKAAAKFNEENHEWDGFPKKKAYKMRDGYSYDGGPTHPSYDPEFDYTTGDDNTEYVVLVDESNCSSKEEKICDPQGNVVQVSYISITGYIIHKYKRIKCTNFLSFIQSPWDPKFEDIEAQFDKVGCKVPYDRNNPEIKNDQTKNNSWGWN